MKNTIYKKIIIASLAIVSIACSEEDLILENPNVPTIEELSNFDDLLVGMYDEYQKIPTNEFVITEMRSDNTSSKSGEGNFGVIDNFRYDEALAEGQDYWANNYTVIRHANNVIRNAENLKPNSIAQGYFMRALCHFNLVRQFQNVSYIDQYIDTEEELVASFPQISEEETYNKIIEDFKLAINTFKKAEEPNTNVYTGTQGAAEVMLAKAYMSRPNKTNVDYNNARLLLEPIIQEGNSYGYILLDSSDSGNESIYGDIFDIGNEKNKEIIFSIAYSEDTSVVTPDLTEHNEGEAQAWSIDMSREGSAQGLNVASEQLIELFDSRVEPVRRQFNLFDTENRFYNNKFRSDLKARSGLDWIVLRYADALLLYVEAVISDQNDTSNPIAVEAFNRVRRRAQVPEVTIINKQQLLDERRIELAYENQRLYDLTRFGIAQSVLKAYSDANGYDFEANEIFLAIPQREIDVTNGFYKQNAGY